MKRKRILTFAAVAAMLAACSSNDIPAPVADKMADTPVTVKAAVADLATRATTQLASGSLGLYFTTDGTDDERYTTENREVKYEESNASWTIQGVPLLWRSSTTPVTYCAYHPYDAKATDIGVVVTAAADQTAALGTDFLYANWTTTTASEDGINIAFEHQMAKLTIILRAGTSLESATYTGVTVGGFVNERSFNPANGQWSDLDKTETTDIRMMKRADGTSFEALLIPQTADLSLTIDTGTDTYTYTQADVTLEAGKAYTLNLQVGKDRVELSSAAAAEWATGTNGKMETEL